MRTRSRPPLERMQRVFGIIKHTKFPSRERLATELEVTTKTVQRDLDFMRDRMGLPIAYSRREGGYYFSEDVKDFPLLQITEAEIVSVFIAQKVLAQYRGTPFEAPLRSAFDKLKSGFHGQMSVSWDDMDSALSFRNIDPCPMETTVFDLCSKATQRHVELGFQYRKLNSTAYEQRRVNPYHLACVMGSWYLFAYDLKRREMRTFVLSRVREVKITDRVFSKPKSFDIQKHLKNSFGVVQGAGKYDVRIRFDAFAAQLIREHIYHPTQKLKELPNGQLEFRLTLTSFDEIIPWILSWGEHAVVLSPNDLILRLRKRLLNAQRPYGCMNLVEKPIPEREI